MTRINTFTLLKFYFISLIVEELNPLFYYYSQTIYYTLTKRIRKIDALIRAILNP